MKSIITISLLILPFFGYSQRKFPASQTEFIFSGSSMNSTTISSSPVVRFSGCINHESQWHYNFNRKTGFYMGIGIKNIGMINNFGSYNLHLKQRAYALTVPLAFKMGKVDRMAFIALGAEANFLFNYKEKFLYGDTKTRKTEWFSNKVNWFNPSVFFQLKFLKTQVITFKYYLNDFLHYQKGGLTLPDGTVVSDYGKSSKLFYVSWGSHLEFKDSDNKNIKKAKNRIRTASLTE